MKYPKITWTCTTCKRYSLFQKTMDSFLSACFDKDLISEWLVGDDGSSGEDIIKMKTRYPFLKIYKNSGTGQAANINNLFSKVQTEWFFHCEDDWFFLRRDSFLKRMFNIVFEDHRVKNVTLRNWYGGEVKHTKNGDKYNVHIYDPDYDGEDKYKRNTPWYGYSLGVSLQHKPTVDMLGKYDENIPPYSRVWDKPQAKKYMDMGFKTANLLDKNYVKHIGSDLKSVYKMRREEYSVKASP